MLLRLVKMQADNGGQKSSEDDKNLISGFQTPTTDGKNLIINFALPKKTFHEILLRNLNKADNNKQSSE